MLDDLARRKVRVNTDKTRPNGTAVQMEPDTRTELQLRRSKEVAEMQKKLTSELCKIEDSLMMLEKERAYTEMKRE